MKQQESRCDGNTSHQTTRAAPESTQTQARMSLKKNWPKASSNKGKRSMKQQESRCDGNTSHQTARAAPDKYTDTGQDVIKKELAEGQL